jgi:hypothetical protein
LKEIFFHFLDTHVLSSGFVALECTVYASKNCASEGEGIHFEIEKREALYSINVTTQEVTHASSTKRDSGRRASSKLSMPLRAKAISSPSSERQRGQAWTSVVRLNQRSQQVVHPTSEQREAIGFVISAGNSRQ